MMIVVLGGACLCCVLSSAGLGGAYFLSESFKDWVDDLFGKEKKETNEDRAKKFKELGCTFSHRLKKPDGSYGCTHPIATYDTGVQHAKKNRPPLSISDAQPNRMMYDVECTRDYECAKLIHDSW